LGKWDWGLYARDTGGGETYFHALMTAWGWTCSVAVLSLILALLIGSIIGIMRTAPSKWMVVFGNSWTQVFRNIPLLVQIFLWYHVIPALFPILFHLPSFVLVVFALGFFTSSRISEQVRAGIQTLPQGQRYAGLAMGLTLPQTYRYVLLPMAYRIIIPPLTSEAMNIFKNTSVAFAVSIAELTMFALQASEETSRFEEIFIPVTFLYFISAYAIHQLAKLIERRVRVPGMLGAK
jgi:glutamate/aspartate transport system permease protein